MRMRIVRFSVIPFTSNLFLRPVLPLNIIGYYYLLYIRNAYTRYIIYTVARELFISASK
jgi:hypothetical protein